MSEFKSRVLRSPRAMLCLPAIVAVLCTMPLSRVFAQDPPATQGATKEQAKVEAVDFKKLKELLPDTVGDLKRNNAEGSKQSIGEMKISQARGTYGEEGKDANATITIVDYGAMPGMADSVAPWQALEVDNESDNEYSRTVKIGDYKGLETFSKESKNGTLMLMVASRFMVTIEINALAPETLKKTGEALKLKELAALAK